MSGVIGPTLLIPKGSSAVQTYTPVSVSDAVAGLGPIAFQFVTENAGTTVTWKVQGSVDGTVYYDIPYITDASGAEAVAARAMTAANSGQIQWLAQTNIRLFKRFQGVVTANTGMVFRLEMYQALPL